MSIDDVSARRLSGTWAEFRDDAATAIEVWRSARWLPLMAIVFSGPGSLSGAATPPPHSATTDAPAWLNGPVLALLAVVIGVLALFSLGWSGAERLACWRVWAGRGTTFRETVSSAFAYMWRYLRLALLVFVPAIVLSGVLSALMLAAVAQAIVTFVVLALLTFVTPVLAYDTDRARDALQEGWRILAGQGAGVRWYAIAGPVVLIALSSLAALGGVWGWLMWPLIGPAALALKGATAAAYLRLTRPDGITAPPVTGP